MIIYGIKTKTCTARKLPKTECNQCFINNAVTKSRKVKYFHLFWIPIFPYKKQIVMRCSNCGHERVLLPQERLNIPKNAFPRNMGLYYSGLILFGIIAIHTIVGEIIRSQEQENYIQQPKMGDVYTIKYIENNQTTYTLYKVSAVSADSVTLLVNDYSADKRKELNIIRTKYKNEYSTAIRMPKSKLLHMKSDNIITFITRE